MSYKSKFEKLVKAIEEAQTRAQADYNEPYWEETDYAAYSAKEILASDLLVIAKKLEENE